MQQKTITAHPGKTIKIAEGDARLVVPLILIATTTVFSNMYVTQPILPIIGTEFGLSPAEAGLTISSMVLAIAGASLFYGLLSDRVGRRPVMIASVFALALPTLLCAVAPNFPLLIFFRILQGALIPGYTAITITYLQEEIPAGRRGMVLGYYVSGTVAGGFFGRLAGGLVTDLTGSWRLAFVFMGLADLALGWALWRYLPVSRHFQPRTANQEPPPPVGAETVTVARFNPATVLVHLRNRQLLSVYLIGFSLMFSFLGLFTYLPYYLVRPPFNLSTLWISSIYVVYLVGTFSAPLSARLADRIGRRGILKGGFSLMLIGVLLTLIPSLPMVAIGLIILCFGMFACQSTATALVGESVEEGSGRGSAVSLYQMFFYIGGSFGGFVPGLLWQAGGWPTLIAVLMVTLGLGLASVFWSARPRPPIASL